MDHEKCSLLHFLTQLDCEKIQDTLVDEFTFHKTFSNSFDQNISLEIYKLENFFIVQINTWPEKKHLGYAKKINDLTKQDFQNLVLYLNSSNRVKKLGITLNIMHNPSFKILADYLNKDTKLISLNLEDNRLSRNQIKLILDALEYHPTLLYLNLGKNCNLTVTIDLWTNFFKTNHNLVSVNLAAKRTMPRNVFDDDSLKNFYEAMLLSRGLKKLDLSRNYNLPVTSLVDFLKVSHLTHLKINHTGWNQIESGLFWSSIGTNHSIRSIWYTNDISDTTASQILTCIQLNYKLTQVNFNNYHNISTHNLKTVKKQLEINVKLFKFNNQIKMCMMMLQKNKHCLVGVLPRRLLMYLLRFI